MFALILSLILTTTPTPAVIDIYDAEHNHMRVTEECATVIVDTGMMFPDLLRSGVTSSHAYTEACF